MERYISDHLITMSRPGARAIADGVVDVKNGAVVWSGPASEAPERPDAVVHHISGILMPGLVDIHCHTPMVLLRGAGEGLPVDRWLQEVMWPREARLTREDVAAGMRWGATELLTAGVTTTVEMYFHSGGVAEAAADVGLRSLVTAPILEDDQLAAFGSWQDQLEYIGELNHRYAHHPLIDVGIGPHAAYSVSDECMRAITAMSADQDLLVHIHVAEQQWEDAAVRERTGMGAPAYLDSVGLLEGRVLAAHGVWLDESEIELFASKNVAVAHCPCSNTKHASGIADVRAMLDAGVRVGIATDGPASHHRLDMFEEMRTALRLARVSTGDAQALNAANALWMATAGAADAIDRSDLGRLVAGARADMVALEIGSAFEPMVEPDEHIEVRTVWSGSPAAVTDVWVEGRRVVADRTVTTVDAREARSEAIQRAARIVS
jgi:5-methylthioadenosine/S-adenosylhomocysteine deaminase